MLIIEKVLFMLSAWGLHLIKHPAAESRIRATATELRKRVQLSATDQPPGRWLTPLQTQQQALNQLNFGMYCSAFVCIPFFASAGLAIYFNDGQYVLAAELLIKIAITLLLIALAFTCLLAVKIYSSRSQLDTYSVMSQVEREAYVLPASLCWRNRDSVMMVALFAIMVFPVWGAM